MGSSKSIDQDNKIYCKLRFEFFGFGRKFVINTLLQTFSLTFSYFNSNMVIAAFALLVAYTMDPIVLVTSRGEPQDACAATLRQCAW